MLISAHGNQYHTKKETLSSLGSPHFRMKIASAVAKQNYGPHMALLSLWKNNIEVDTASLSPDFSINFIPINLLST